MGSSRKRYVLLAWEGVASIDERKRLARLLEQRHGRVTIIAVDGCDGSLVVKTDAREAASMRESFVHVVIGGRRIESVLTSGCIGKLKKRARASAATNVGKVS